MQQKTLVLGLGNPLLGDDGVGIEIVRALKQEDLDAEFEETNSSGFEVAEKMLGYERVFVVDAIAGRVAGRVHFFGIEDLKPTIHFTSPHDTNIQTAIEFLRTHSEFPKTVKFVGVEIIPNPEFREGLSKDVKEAIPEAKKIILKELRGGILNENR
ncbi:MAG: hydrogenase maturation protease [Thermoplasmata archaeon]